MLDRVVTFSSMNIDRVKKEIQDRRLLSKKNILELQERILVRIAAILTAVYHEPAEDLSVENLSAKLAFKGDPHLNELRLALERIGRHEYGLCIFCKGDIAIEILRELPTAHFCESCAEKLVQKNITFGMQQSIGKG
jgi:RNA polymerase-binding transcription factor DksA